MPKTKPIITSLSPNAVMAGGPAFKLTVNGQNFPPHPIVRWNGNHLQTSVDNKTQLTADVSASDLATEGTATVDVIDPKGNIRSNERP